MIEALVIQKEPREGLIALLRDLLGSGKVKGIIALGRDIDGVTRYTMVTDPGRIADLDPLYPVMPANLGRELSRLTTSSSFRDPVAVVMRPCELRGFVEAIKRKQGTRENIIVISHTCAGVFPLKAIEAGTSEGPPHAYQNALAKGEILESVRPACQSCSEFVPYGADVALEALGKKDESLFLLHSEKARSIARDIVGIHEPREFERSIIESVRRRRKEAWARLSSGIVDKKGLEGLVRLFGRCIGCHACSDACPICYCTLCNFESSSSEYGPADFEREAGKRGGVRVPPGTVYFHLGRMAHMSLSCVACGSCQDVCPTGIPVSLLFKKVGEQAQHTFGYTPGRDPGQPIPVITFEKEEFLDVEG